MITQGIDELQKSREEDALRDLLNRYEPRLESLVRWLIRDFDVVREREYGTLKVTDLLRTRLETALRDDRVLSQLSDTASLDRVARGKIRLELKKIAERVRAREFGRHGPLPDAGLPDDRDAERRRAFELRTFFLEALDTLPEEERTAVELQYFQEPPLGAAEAAAHMGISSHRFRTLMVRALRRIADRYRDQDE